MAAGAGEGKTSGFSLELQGAQLAAGFIFGSPLTGRDTVDTAEGPGKMKLIRVAHSISDIANGKLCQLQQFRLQKAAISSTEISF